MPKDRKQHLVDGKYTVRDLVDLKKLHGIFQHFTDAMGFTIGFLSIPDMEILIATGWRDICAKFHRRCPRAAENCRESNRHLTRPMTRPGKIVVERCANGLVDCAMPIFIKGKCVAILATGQVLLEPPDLSRFRKQAKAFGYNERSYMAALEDVPVISAKRLRQVTGFLKELASLVAELGYAGLKEKEKARELALDIERRIEAEKALKEMADQLQSFYGAVTDGVLVAEVATKRILKANAKACQLFGYTEKEFLRKRIPSLHPSSKIKKILGFFRDLLSEDRTLVSDVPCRKRNGAVFFADIVAQPVIFQGRKCLVGFFRDITERRQAEDALRASESRYRGLIDLAVDGILTSTHEGVIIDANECMCGLVGMPREALVGKYIGKLPFTKASLEKQPFRFDLLKKNETVVRERALIRPDGSVIEVEMRTKMMPDGTYQSIYRDITARKQVELKLQSSEQRYRSIFESSQDAMLTLEPPSWRFTSGNDAMVRMFRAKDSADFIAHAPWALSPRRQPDGSLSSVKAKKMIRTAMRKGFHFFEWTHRRIKGGTFPAEVLLTRVQREGGVFLNATVRDITERKQAEAKLLDDEFRMSALSENLAQGMVYQIESRLDGRKRRFVFVSSAVKRLHGLSVESVLRDPDLIYRQLIPEDQALVAEQETQAAKSMKTLNVEVRIRVLKGAIQWRQFVSSPRRSPDGQSILWDGIELDITDRKEAEKALKESEERFRLVVNNSLDAVYRRNIPSGRYDFFSAAVERITGFSPKELTGKDLDFIVNRVHPDDLAALKAALERAQNGHLKDGTIDYRLKRKDGDYCWLSDRFTVIDDSNGRPLYWVGVSRDVTNSKKSEAVLEQHRALLRATGRMAHVGGWEFELKTRKLVWSEEVYRIYEVGVNYQPQVEKAMAFYTSFSRPLIEQALKRAVDHGEGFDLELEIITAQGNPKWVHVRGGVDQKQGIVRGTFQDITHRKKLERALEKRILALTQPVGGGEGIEFEQLFNIDEIQKIQDEFTKATGVASIITHPDGTPITQPSNFCCLCRDIIRKTKLGLANCYRSDACIGRQNPGGPIIQTCLSGGLWDAGASISVGGRHVANWLIGQVRDKTQSEEKIRAYARKIGADEGKIAEAFRQVTAMPRAQFDKVAQLLFTMAKQLSQFAYQNIQQSRAITESRRAEALIRAGRHQLLQVIDTVPHMIFAKDKSGRFLLVNRAMGNLYGKEPQALIGALRKDVHPNSEEAKLFLKADQEVLASGKPMLFSNEPFTDVRGCKHVLQTIKIPFTMAGMKEPCVLGVSVDVTEQRKIEEFRNEIVRTVSHELRTPLSIEKEGISLLMDGVLGAVSPEQKEILETVMRSIERLSRMITSLLDISSIETGKISLSKMKTDLMALVKDVVFEFKKRAAEKGLELRVKPPEHAVPVLADPDKLTQVLSNLVDNAVKFTASGFVEISMRVLSDKVECSVQDTGIGISEENIGKLFEKFQQFSRMAGPGERGFGLGLSIVKGIVEMHGGEIRVASQLGEGTRVTFSLPLFRKEKS